MRRYKEMPLPPDQILLFGKSVEEAVPADSDVRGFKDAMDSLDYSPVESEGSGRGCPPYPPDVMVKILTYAYSKGLRSSRKIELLLGVDVRFLWLSGGLKPDHNTIARFRKDNWDALESLFKDSVRICSEAGLISLEVVAVDGTRIAAAASKKKVYSQSKVDRQLAWAEKVLQEAEAVDRAEDEAYGSARGDELPEHLRDAKERKAKLEEIARRLREEKKNAVVETDPDSRVMLTGSGKLPAYNLQAAVDEKNQVIVGMKLVQAEDDHGELPGMVQEVIENTGRAPDMSLGDCGYIDEATLLWIKLSGHKALIPPQEGPREDPNDLFARRCFLPDDEEDALVCPAGKKLPFKSLNHQESGTYRRYRATGCQKCSFYEECVKCGKGSRCISMSIVEDQRVKLREMLATPEGRELYRLRQQTVEPVFGQMKTNRGFGRFTLWGYDGARAESALICLAHNVAKYTAKATSLAKAQAGRLLGTVQAIPNRQCGRHILCLFTAPPIYGTA